MQDLKLYKIWYSQYREIYNQVPKSAEKGQFLQDLGNDFGVNIFFAMISISNQQQFLEILATAYTYSADWCSSQALHNIYEKLFYI